MQKKINILYIYVKYNLKNDKNEPFIKIIKNY